MQKVRTSCPKCGNKIIVDIPDQCEEQKVVCPHCGNKFTIRPKITGEECSWEEHGEPRKTVLSSIKPRTNKPLIATMLLVTVFILGVSTAFFPHLFIETSLDLSTALGMTGSVKIDIEVLNQTVNFPDNITVKIDGVEDLTMEKQGLYLAKNVKTGFQKIKVSTSGYKNVTSEILVTPFHETYSKIILEKGLGEKEINFNLLGLTLMLTIISIFPLMAALTAFKRFHIDVAFVGSLIGVFTFGFFLIGSALSIIAFILIWLSRDEFENGKKGKIF